MRTLRKTYLSTSPGPAHISALAVATSFPGFREGYGVFRRLRAGWLRSCTHALVSSTHEIGSPVTRKAFGEAIKQIRAVAREYGPFDSFISNWPAMSARAPRSAANLLEGMEERNRGKGATRKRPPNSGTARDRRRTASLRTRERTGVEMHLFWAIPSSRRASLQTIRAIRSITFCRGAGSATTRTSTRRCARYGKSEQTWSDAVRMVRGGQDRGRMEELCRPRGKPEGNQRPQEAQLFAQGRAPVSRTSLRRAT